MADPRDNWTLEDWKNLAEYRWKMVMDMHEAITEATEDYKCDAPIGAMWRAARWIKASKAKEELIRSYCEEGCPTGKEPWDGHSEACAEIRSLLDFGEKSRG